MTNANTQELGKIAAGKAAANFIQDGMLVGLGTGSTATYFIDSLINRCRHEGLRIQAVASSERSAKQARNGGIPLLNIDQMTTLDIVVDGADEIDSQKRMIKGGGGALLREKILASLSKEMVVVVDSHKLVNQLGAFPLPVEIVPFAHNATLHRIRSLGYNSAFRMTPKNTFYLTDNGNYIIDIHFKSPLESPQREDAILKAIPGVVETGFFFNLAGRVLVGYPDGQVKLIL